MVVGVLKLKESLVFAPLNFVLHETFILVILTQLQHQALRSSFILRHLESDPEGPLHWFYIHLLWFLFVEMPWPD